MGVVSILGCVSPLLCLRQIEGRLKVHPKTSRRAKRLGKIKSRIGRNTAFALDYKLADKDIRAALMSCASASLGFASLAAVRASFASSLRPISVSTRPRWY